MTLPGFRRGFNYKLSGCNLLNWTIGVVVKVTQSEEMYLDSLFELN